MKRWVCLLAMGLLAAGVGAAQDEQAQQPEGEYVVFTAAELVVQADEKLAAGDEDGAATALENALRAEGATGEMGMRLGVMREKLRPLVASEMR